MGTAIATFLKPLHKPFTRRQTTGLVFCCTLLGAAAQILMKSGANHLERPGVMGILQSTPLMAGYVLYGINTVLLTLALRDGELSVLYPIIALSYVWVTFLSVMVFRESMNPFKLLGISIIVLGVGILGKGGKT